MSSMAVLEAGHEACSAYCINQETCVTKVMALLGGAMLSLCGLYVHGTAAVPCVSQLVDDH